MARSVTVDKRENEKRDSQNEQKNKKRKKKENYLLKRTASKT